MKMLQPQQAGIWELAQHLYKSRQGWRHPIYLIHAMTAKCNARCGFCAWNPEFYQGHDELSTEEVKTLYRDARRAGFMALSMWGGEPLLRRDFSELAQFAKAQGFLTHIVTNGFLLEKKLDEVAPHLDRICISVDHPSEKHDQLRGTKGLYGKILSATLRLKSRYPSTKIVYNYTIQKANADPETLEEMARLMKQLGVVGIFNGLRVDAAMPDGQEVDLAAYNPSDEALTQAFRKVEELKRRGFPIVNSYTHIRKMIHAPMRYRCHWPKFMLPIEANGDVVDCMHWGTRPIASLRDISLAEVLEHPRLQALAGPAGEACHQCVSLHRVEISEAWEGRVEPLVSWARALA